MDRRGFIKTGAGVVGGLLTGFEAEAQIRPCAPPTVSVDQGPPVATSCNIAAAADWQSRISGPGVVWYHNFDARAEVDQFRWAASYGSGNDPLARAPFASNLSWQPAGGADGGPYLRLFRPAGAGVADGYVWWRQFSPLTGASNGRGVDDPGAGGSIPLQTFTPTDGGDQTNRWAETQARPGYYGKAGYEAAGNYGNPTYPQYASIFDGNEFYLQVRVKTQADRMTVGNVVNGKLLNFCTTWGTHPNQELVTVSAYPLPSSPLGGPYQGNVHNMYEGAFTGYIGQGSNATGPIMNPTGPKWAYSGGWDTLLYHIKPGSQNPSNPPFTYDTTIEVWAAHPGETSYTQIWQVGFRAIYDDTEQFGRYRKYAWNAFLCWIYQNWENNVTDIVQCYDQVIFSKAFIACPAT